MWLKIDRELKTSLLAQITRQLREKILSKELKPGERLPPTRKLADDLKVSRNIILQVYDTLIAEGYLETIGGSGTYVAEDAFLEKYKAYYTKKKNHADKQPGLEQDNIISFEPGEPDFTLFPRKTFARFLKEAQINAVDDDLAYGNVQGMLPLREAVSEYLLRNKGIKSVPGQIVILSGSAQAFELLNTIFPKTHKSVIIEDPLYAGITTILKKQQFTLTPIPVDEKGITVELLPEKTDAEFIIVTPSHQFPCGAILPIQRRIALVKYAREKNMYIVENDYDSEFRYSAAPVSSLQLLDEARVIHIGTFSETVYPSLRIGYMVLPGALIEKAQKVIKQSAQTTPAIMQLGLAAFIKEGFLERHISKIKKVYLKKRNLLINHLKQRFNDKILITGETAGTFIVVTFVNHTFTSSTLKKLEEHNVTLTTFEENALNKNRNLHKVIMGFGNLPENLIIEGVKRLHKALSYCNKK